MANRQQRVIKSVFIGLLWLLLRVPVDLAIAQQSLNKIFPYAITLQLVDFIVISYLLFKMLELRLRRPWKCPACDGHGVRYFVPGQDTGKLYGQVPCKPCGSSGIIWEIVSNSLP